MAAIPGKIPNESGLAGFEELSFDGGNEKYGVGVTKMVRAGKPYRKGIHFFSFVPEKKGK